MTCNTVKWTFQSELLYRSNKDHLSEFVSNSDDLYGEITYKLKLLLASTATNTILILPVSHSLKYFHKMFFFSLFISILLRFRLLSPVFDKLITISFNNPFVLLIKNSYTQRFLCEPHARRFTKNNVYTLSYCSMTHIHVFITRAGSY